uniref:Secreted protein n=1 Tax=Steinernema glaseri TaxID=37863 RepID=A0A1I7XXR9_9BILA
MLLLNVYYVVIMDAIYGVSEVTTLTVSHPRLMRWLCFRAFLGAEKTIANSVASLTRGLVLLLAGGSS